MKQDVFKTIDFIIMVDLKIINKFPDDFTFGVATSSYQFEGYSFGKSGLSHWDNFSNQEGRVFNN